MAREFIHGRNIRQSIFLIAQINRRALLYNNMIISTCLRAGWKWWTKEEDKRESRTLFRWCIKRRAIIHTHRRRNINVSWENTQWGVKAPYIILERRAIVCGPAIFLKDLYASSYARDVPIGLMGVAVIDRHTHINSLSYRKESKAERYCCTCRRRPKYI